MEVKMKKIIPKLIGLLSFIITCSILSISIFASDIFSKIEPFSVMTRYSESKVSMISSSYVITLKNKMSIDDVSGYFYDIPSVTVASRGNLPSRYTTPTVYRFVKNRKSSYTIRVTAELYTVDKDYDNMNISQIVEYNVSSPGPM